jgi:hypothetical protein
MPMALGWRPIRLDSAHRIVRKPQRRSSPAAPFFGLGVRGGASTSKNSSNAQIDSYVHRILDQEQDQSKTQEEHQDHSEPPCTSQGELPEREIENRSSAETPSKSVNQTQEVHNSESKRENPVSKEREGAEVSGAELQSPSPESSGGDSLQTQQMQSPNVQHHPSVPKKTEDASNASNKQAGRSSQIQKGGQSELCRMHHLKKLSHQRNLR